MKTLLHAITFLNNFHLPIFSIAVYVHSQIQTIIKLFIYSNDCNTIDFNLAKTKFEYPKI